MTDHPQSGKHHQCFLLPQLLPCHQIPSTLALHQHVFYLLPYNVPRHLVCPAPIEPPGVLLEWQRPPKMVHLCDFSVVSFDVLFCDSTCLVQSCLFIVSLFGLIYYKRPGVIGPLMYETAGTRSDFTCSPFDEDKSLVFCS